MDSWKLWSKIHGQASLAKSLLFHTLALTTPHHLHHLQRLYIHTDGLQLTETLLNSTLSRDIGKLQNLKYLDLRNSRFRGTIPSELATLTSLKFLFLAHNDFGPGTVPSELGGLLFLGKSSLCAGCCHNVLEQITLMAYTMM